MALIVLLLFIWLGLEIPALDGHNLALFNSFLRSFSKRLYNK
jgi:hypothetical protein